MMLKPCFSFNALFKTVTKKKVLFVLFFFPAGCRLHGNNEACLIIPLGPSGLLVTQQLGGNLNVKPHLNKHLGYPKQNL